MSKEHLSSWDTLISAMRILSSEIQSQDGIANAAILEASQRMQSLHDAAMDVLEWYYRVGDVGGAVDPMDHLRETVGVTEAFLCRK